MSRPAPPVVRIATAMVGSATWFLPERFRGTWAADIRETFEDEAREAYRRNGVTSLVRITALAFADIAASVWERPPAGRRVTMAAFSQDLRYAVRSYARQPGFTIAVLLMLALGIGGNAAIFTLVDAALLRPLPYPDADRLVRVWGHHLPTDERRNPVNPNDAADWRQGSAAIAALGVSTATTQPLTGIGDPVTVPVAFVSSGYFETLQVQPALGRAFDAGHDKPGRETEVVVTHGFWQRVLGGDPAVLRRTINLADVTCRIIGVLPPEFVSPGIRSAAEPQVWRPLVVDPENRGGHFTAAIARLRPGASLGEAEAQVNAVAEGLSRRFPSTSLGQRARLEPLRRAIAGDTRAAVLLLMAAVAVVLLVVCANVASLLLARAAGRRRELAVRRALGATRGRVVRQLLTESLLLAVVAAAAGIGVALLALNAFPEWLADEWPTAIQATVDARVMAFTLLLSFGTVLLFGLAPAVVASRDDVRQTLVATSAGSGRRMRRFQSLLVVAETALAVILLVAASLLVKSLAALGRVDPGFTTAQTLTFRLTLPRTRYAEPGRRSQFHQRVIERLAAQPGVAAVGGVNTSPLSARYSCDSFGLADRPAPPDGQEPCAEVRVATPGYFAAMGIPLAEGRQLEAADVAGTMPVVVINTAMAEKYWPAGSAVGQRLKWGSAASASPWLTIVGVIGNVRHFGLDEAAPDEVYMPLAQSSASAITYAVRADSPSFDLRDSVRAIVRDLDPALPVAEMFTTAELVSRSMALPSFRTRLLTAFAALALLLALAGVYSLMVFQVNQRRREIGVRLALGATARGIERLIIGNAAISVGIGCTIGTLASIPLMQLTRDVLFGVTPGEPLAYVLASGLLLATTLVASYVAARRAMQFDPLEIIRAD